MNDKEQCTSIGRCSEPTEKVKLILSLRLGIKSKRAVPQKSRQLLFIKSGMINLSQLLLPVSVSPLRVYEELHSRFRLYTKPLSLNHQLRP